MFSCEFHEIFNNTFSYRTSPVVASVIIYSWLWNHVQSQQQKNNVRFLHSLRGGMAEVCVECVCFWVWAVLVKQVVLSSFWVVFDDFCWLQVIGDIEWFRWFAVLVVKQISQHMEELFLYCTHWRTWLTEVIQLFYSK